MLSDKKKKHFKKVLEDQLTELTAQLTAPDPNPALDDWRRLRA